MRNIMKAASLGLMMIFAVHSVYADAGFFDKCPVKGGLVVVIGDDDTVAREFKGRDSWLVHLLTTSEEACRKGRSALRTAECYGRISVDVGRGDALPYRDRLASVVVLARDADFSDEELMRVLRPGGCIARWDGQAWSFETKPRPETIDNWTHFLHSANNNAVSKDLEVDEPKGAMWSAGPRYHRFHSTVAGMSAMVTDAGRIFYISDEGPVADYRAPRQWWLVARDAFSGVELWRREMPEWYMERRGFRTGPAHLTRPLVVDGNRLFVTPQYKGKVHVLNASSGETLRVLEETEGAREFVYDGKALYIVTARDYEGAEIKHGRFDVADRTALMAVDPESGETVWSQEGGDFKLIMPLTVAVSGQTMAVHTQKKFMCLDPQTGKIRWSVPRKHFKLREGWSTPTVSIIKEVILVADRVEMNLERVDEKQREKVPEEWLTWVTKPNACRGMKGVMTAYAAADGKELWKTPCAGGFSAPADVFYADGLVWVSEILMRDNKDFTKGRDLHTGEVKREIETENAFPQFHHHRCYRPKATERYIVLGRQGTELIDLSGKGENDRNMWVRGTCQYGVVPANGMIYAPPHYCACYPEAKLAGLWALSPRSALPQKPFEGERLERFDDVDSSDEAKPSDWPTYRCDPARSGASRVEVGNVQAQSWKTDFAGKITAPIVAAGKVFLAEVDTHSVHAVDLTSGKRLWSYTAGGAVDSPPTYHNGRIYFGSVDGRIYCLDAATGKPVWRFLAAPADRRMVYYDRLESVWPVHGSVLIHDGSLWAAAGRSSYLDGGIALWRLDPETGEVLAHSRLSHEGVETGLGDELKPGNRMIGALNDILSAGDNASVFMRHNHFDTSFEKIEPDWHIYNASGYLDDSWFNRTYWIYGMRMWGEYKGWPVASFYVPHGRILSKPGDRTLVGFGRPANGWKMERTDKQRLYKLQFNKEKAFEAMPPEDGYVWKKRKPDGSLMVFDWEQELPIWVRAMATAGDALVIAGPRTGRRMEAHQILAGEAGASLMLVSMENGEVSRTIDLESPPVWDGLAVVPERVVVSTIDGKLRCFGGE